MSNPPTEFNWQCATVTAVEAGRVRVRFDPLRDCGRCLRGEGCGAGVFSRLFSPRGSELWLDSSLRLQPGQPVRVGVQARDLIRAAGLLYGLPLLSFIIAAGLAGTVTDQALASDLVGLAAGLAAATASLWMAGRLRRRILNPRLESLSGTAERPAAGQ